MISTLAKKIRAKRPTMKWTDAIKAASKELKASGKITASKSTRTKRKTTTRKPVTKRIAGRSTKAYKKHVVYDNPQRIYVDINTINQRNPDRPSITIKGKRYLIWDDRDGAYGINWQFNGWQAGVYLYDYKTGKPITEHFYDDMSGVKKYPKPKTFKPTPAQTKAAAKRLVKQATSKRRVNGSHTDTKSHNVRINVLSGLQGQQVVLNGVKTLVKGNYYIYMDTSLKTGYTKKNTLLKYVGKRSSGAFPLVFDVFKKSTTGAYVNSGRYEYAAELIKYLSKVKKPTSKELAIGHLKLYD